MFKRPTFSMHDEPPPLVGVGGTTDFPGTGTNAPKSSDFPGTGTNAPKSSDFPGTGTNAASPTKRTSGGSCPAGTELNPKTKKCEKSSTGDLSVPSGGFKIGGFSPNIQDGSGSGSTGGATGGSTGGATGGSTGGATGGTGASGSGESATDTVDGCASKGLAFWEGLGCVSISKSQELAAAQAACMQQGAKLDPKTITCIGGTMTTGCNPPNIFDQFKGDCLSFDQNLKRAQEAKSCSESGKYWNAHTASCQDEAPDVTLCADGKPADPQKACQRMGSGGSTGEGGGTPGSSTDGGSDGGSTGSSYIGDESSKGSGWMWALGALLLLGGAGAYYYVQEQNKKGSAGSMRMVPNPVSSGNLTSLSDGSSNPFRMQNPIDGEAYDAADAIMKLEDRDMSAQAQGEFLAFSRNFSDDTVADLLLCLSVYRLSEPTMLYILSKTKKVDSGARRKFFDEVRRRLYDIHRETAKVDKLLREVRLCSVDPPFKRVSTKRMPRRVTMGSSQA